MIFVHCSRKTELSMYGEIKLNLLFRMTSEGKSFLKMATIKLKHDLDWIVDHLVSQPGYLNL